MSNVHKAQEDPRLPDPGQPPDVEPQSCNSCQSSEMNGNERIFEISAFTPSANGGGKKLSSNSPLLRG